MFLPFSKYWKLSSQSGNQQNIDSLFPHHINLDFRCRINPNGLKPICYHKYNVVINISFANKWIRVRESSQCTHKKWNLPDDNGLFGRRTQYDAAHRLRTSSVDIQVPGGQSLDSPNGPNALLVLTFPVSARTLESYPSLTPPSLNYQMNITYKFYGDRTIWWKERRTIRRPIFFFLSLAFIRVGLRRIYRYSYLVDWQKGMIYFRGKTVSSDLPQKIYNARESAIHLLIWC